MKSPHEIAARMQRQWRRKRFRLAMLTSVDTWPMSYSIGLASAADMATNPGGIREHVLCWQQVKVGQVDWQDVNYRASSEPVRIPTHWIMERPSDWVLATKDGDIAADYDLLEYLSVNADAEVRDALISSLKLLQGRSREELMAAVTLASRLKPGEAQGRPLRLLAGYGVDTKFFERNHQLLLRLLDARYAGEVSRQGLHGFLNAIPDGEHWLLLVALHNGLLPFKAQQVRSQELAGLARDANAIRARRVLVVENRQCWHMLPELEDTIAILGSGLDLDWLRADWLKNREVAYWGDIDTWGLSMLARARQHQPQLVSILTDRRTFEQHEQGNAVVESVCAGDEPPHGLSADERRLYRWLMTLERGRLEQEFLPVELVHDALRQWVARS